MAFERTNNSTGHHAIFNVALTGRGLRRITPWRLDASQPQYSPHGRWIAFRSDETSDTSGSIVSAENQVSNGDLQNADIYFIPTSGGTPVDVTNTPNQWESASDWGTGRA